MTDGHHDRHGPRDLVRVDLQLDRPVRADVAAGLRLDAGHPFLIRSHTAGDTIHDGGGDPAADRRRAAGAERSGRSRLNLPLTPDRTRPPAWGARE